MTTIPLVGTDFKRLVAKEAVIEMKNRYAEKNPSLNEDPVSVISRPGMRKFAEVGTGPIRKVFSSPGAFNSDLFVVSGTTLYRVSSTNLAVTTIGAISSSTSGDVSMAATAPIGVTPGYLFIAEGGILWVYTDNGHALGTLSASGTIANGDVVRIDGTYYQWTTGSVVSGTAVGTLANPWLVARGASNATALQNMYYAINATGTADTTYTGALTAHTTVQATQVTAAALIVEARTAGTAGNAIVTTETGAFTAWGGGTLASGGSAELRQVTVPSDYGAISVATINSFVIVIPVQSSAIKGQFYFIEPGEITINPLNYATAERNPDGLHQVVVFGDMFWLLGENTTEPWVITGNVTSPVARFKGILFDRGSWEGTAVQVKDSLIVVDEDGAVFQISGGQKRISRPDIEEQIRRAKQIESL